MHSRKQDDDEPYGLRVGLRGRVRDKELSEEKSARTVARTGYTLAARNHPDTRKATPHKVQRRIGSGATQMSYTGDETEEE